MRSIPPAPVIVYRAMGTDGAGKILTGARYAELGVRPGVDIKVDAAGLVQPGDRGMSVVPDSPVHLFPGVRPRALPGGRGSLPIFWLDSSELPSGLVLVPTKIAPSPLHSVIGPARDMLLTDLQVLLANTLLLWKPWP